MDRSPFPAPPGPLERGQDLLEADAYGARNGMALAQHAPEDAAWLAMGNKVEDLERYAGPALAGPIVAAWREMSRVHIDTVQELRWARDAVSELRGDYASACRLVAEMHKAAFGRTTGPVHHGPVEDMAALGDALREIAGLLVTNPGEPDGIDGRDPEHQRAALVRIRDLVVHALDGPREPQPDQPLDDDPDLHPGVPIRDGLQAHADELRAAKLLPGAPDGPRP